LTSAHELHAYLWVFDPWFLSVPCFDARLGVRKDRYNAFGNPVVVKQAKRNPGKPLK
jgi:hypothetical protein